MSDTPKPITGPKNPETAHQYYSILKAVRTQQKMDDPSFTGIRSLSRLTGIPRDTVRRRLMVLESRGAVRIIRDSRGRVVSVERVDPPRPVTTVSDSDLRSGMRSVSTSLLLMAAAIIGSIILATILAITLS